MIEVITNAGIIVLNLIGCLAVIYLAGFICSIILKDELGEFGDDDEN